MANQNLLLAPGFKLLFLPTDEQIIGDYLFNRVHGNPLPSNEVIIECNLYGESHVWQKHFLEKAQKILYFFTTLNKKTEKGNRIVRVTQCGGTWKSQTDKKVLDSLNQHIGSQRSFSFVPKKDIKETSWVMHEFRLDGILLNDNANVHHLVLCRISKNVINVKKQEEETNDDNARLVSSVSDDDHMSICSHICGRLGRQKNFSFIGKGSNILETHLTSLKTQGRHCFPMLLPSGYKIVFAPTDGEIILDYLFKKVWGNRLSSDEVTVCDLYDRCHVWRKIFEEKKKDMLYFFTELKKKGSSSRFERGTKCGCTWRAQNDNKIFHSSTNNQHIGSRRSFGFVPKKWGTCECDDHDHHQVKGTRWAMHEYRLDGMLLKYSQINNKATDAYVLCRVIKKVKKEQEIGDDGGNGKSNMMMSEADELSDGLFRSFAEDLPNLIPLPEDATLTNEIDSKLGICLEDLADDDECDNKNIEVRSLERVPTHQDQLSNNKRIKADDGINGWDYKKEEEPGYLLEDIVRPFTYYCRDPGADS